MTVEARETVRKLAHDLRNSLGAIYANAQVLQMSLSGANREDDAESAREIYESAKHIEELIAQHLD